jgi:hypothetical protein
MSDEDTKKAQAIGEEMGKCMQKAMTPEAPAAPADPAAAGSGAAPADPAAAGSAAPAAEGAAPADPAAAKPEEKKEEPKK